MIKLNKHATNTKNDNTLNKITKIKNNQIQNI